MQLVEKHRICLTLHYDGGGFFGWQVQPEARTVQGEVERVLGRLLDGAARITGSGRTDRGVHAAGQVATVDVPVRWTPEELQRALNALLPEDVWVVDARTVTPDFHARYDALARSYVYRIGLSPVTSSPFHSRWCWPLRSELDRAAMDEATSLLVGDHSFLAFAKAGQEERGDRCVVASARWMEWRLGIQLEITANRFLHHMVRYLAGTLVDIGQKRRPVADVASLLKTDTPLETSPPAPPEGLFLYSVGYAAERWEPSTPAPPPDLDHLP